MAWLCEMKIKKGPVHTDCKINVGQASTVSAAVAKSLIRAVGHSIVVPPPAPFVLLSNPVGVFKGGDMIGGEMVRWQVSWFSARVNHQRLSITSTK